MAKSGNILFDQMFSDYAWKYNDPELATKKRYCDVIWNNWPGLAEKFGREYEMLSAANQQAWQNTIVLRYQIPAQFVYYAVHSLIRLLRAGKLTRGFWTPVAAKAAQAVADQQTIAAGGVAGTAQSVLQTAKKAATKIGSGISTIASDAESGAKTGVHVIEFLYKWKKPLIIGGIGLAAYIYSKPLISRLKNLAGRK